MRTWGRVADSDGNLTIWEEVTTDKNGLNTGVYITTLIQTLKLVLGESPFYANVGIPSAQSVIQQIFPTFFVNQVQNQFAQYFASLIISQVPNIATPTYSVQIITLQGTNFSQLVSGVPQ